MLYNKINQPHVYIYPLPLGPLSHPLPSHPSMSPQSKFPLAIYFTHGSVHRSIPTSQFTPLPLLHQSVSTCPFSTFVSLFLLCKIKSPIPFFYIPHTCINIQYFFLSDLLHSMTDSRSIHISTNVTQFCHFNGWVIFPCIYVPPLPYPFICSCTSGLLSCPG